VNEVLDFVNFELGPVSALKLNALLGEKDLLLHDSPIKEIESVLKLVEDGISFKREPLLRLIKIASEHAERTLNKTQRPSLGDISQELRWLGYEPNEVDAVVKALNKTRGELEHYYSRLKSRTALLEEEFNAATRKINQVRNECKSQTAPAPTFWSRLWSWSSPSEPTVETSKADPQKTVREIGKDDSGAHSSSVSKTSKLFKNPRPSWVKVACSRCFSLESSIKIEDLEPYDRIKILLNKKSLRPAHPDSVYGTSVLGGSSSSQGPLIMEDDITSETSAFDNRFEDLNVYMAEPKETACFSLPENIPKDIGCIEESGCKTSSAYPLDFSDSSDGSLVDTDDRESKLPGLLLKCGKNSERTEDLEYVERGSSLSNVSVWPNISEGLPERAIPYVSQYTDAYSFFSVWINEAEQLFERVEDLKNDNNAISKSEGENSLDKLKTEIVPLFYSVRSKLRKSYIIQSDLCRSYLFLFKNKLNRESIMTLEGCGYPVGQVKKMEEFLEAENSLISQIETEKKRIESRLEKIHAQFNATCDSLVNSNKKSGGLSGFFGWFFGGSTDHLSLLLEDYIRVNGLADSEQDTLSKIDLRLEDF
jgi:hypothetical protein